MLPASRGTITPIISVSGFDMFTAPAITFPPCSQTRVHYGRIALGGPGLDGLQRAIAADARVPLRAITGTVTDASGAPAAGARVHATSMDGARYLDRVSADAMGRFELRVPAGPAPPGLALGSAPTAVVPVAEGASTASLVFPADGSIAVEATEAGSAQALPVRVQVIPRGRRRLCCPRATGRRSRPTGGCTWPSRSTVG